ncbi:MAG TPA: HDOD domain-containing protein [Verrucomicrobiae bacterium]|nr:HDOD domain-containing protein [Verrucomicrobiae bacterium]
MPTASHLNVRSHVQPAALALDAVVAMQLLTVFRDSDHDIDQVVGLVNQHPALAEEMLKRCNRVKFYDAGPITDIFEAVSRVGFYELYNIVSDSLIAQGIMPETAEQPAEVLQWDVQF